MGGFGEKSMVHNRLTVLSSHLWVSAANSSFLGSETTTTPVKPSGDLKGSLTVFYNQTGRNFEVKANEGGLIRVNDFKMLTIGRDGRGLKLYDLGYSNTTLVYSSISYIDGDEGLLRYRGYPIEE
jgi:citrate synthase